MLNVVAVQGRLVADPELRHTTTGRKVATLRLACDRGRKDANGQTVADFFNVICWEAAAEFVCKYFQKGAMILIDGRLQSRTYTDRSGANRTAVEIVAGNINFAGSKAQNAPAGGAAYPQQTSASAANSQQAYAVPSGDDFAVIDDDDDLPF